MTTTTLNTNTLLSSIKGADSSSLTIEPNIIKEALSKGVLIKLAERDGRAGGSNIYYQVGHASNNTILMHVKNNMYVVISRRVYCSKLNKHIDVLPVLLQFSFYSNRKSSNRCHIVTGTPKTLKEQGFAGTVYLTRILVSLEKYGELRRLDSSYDVHHKSDCWDNRQHMIMYVDSSKHTHRNSHMTGRYIRNYDTLLNVLELLNESYIKLSTVTTIS